MSGSRVTAFDIELDDAATAVIDGYLAELTRRLPANAPLAADVLAELREDLLEATAKLADGSLDNASAARTATVQFGGVDDLVVAFEPELAVRQARRIGMTLLATGPLVGTTWVAALFLTASPLAGVWRWLPLAVLPLLLLGGPATVLTVITTGRLTRWLRPQARLTNGAVAVAGLTAGTLDAVLLVGTVALLLAPVPAPSPLLALAVVASLARLVFVSRAALHLLGRRHPHEAPTRLA
jgi:hypothetical protein